MCRTAPDTENSVARPACHVSCYLLIVIALLLPITASSAADEETGSDQARAVGSWGSSPCEGIAMDNFEACPEALVGAQTCCGVGVCASTGQFQCNGGQLQDSCVPGDPVSSSDTSCDGVDQDCSGEADEDYQNQSTTCGTGACSATGQTVCQDGEVSDTCTPGTPSPETCNGIDDNCDGTIDEGLGGETTSCGTGACSAEGQLICNGGEFVDTCEPGEPSDEVCNGIDDNCDGTVDEGLGGETTSCGIGACSATGQLICDGGEFVDTCEPGEPAPDEICGDDIDNDCDGEVDEGC